MEQEVLKAIQFKVNEKPNIYQESYILFKYYATSYTAHKVVSLIPEPCLRLVNDFIGFLAKLVLFSIKLS